jgi:CheY-like chemotaxis protein
LTEIDTSASGQTTILVVDDDQVLRKILSIWLAKSGYSVVEANDGWEALEIVAQQPVGGILLDVMMPGIDGFQVCQRVKSDPATAHIPVVLVTALTGQRRRQQGLKAGADDFISKPVKPADLLDTVRRVMQAGPSSEQPIENCSQS